MPKHHLFLLTLSLFACRKGDLDDDGVESPADCNDNDATIRPDAPEECDGLDNNCDGAIDEVDTSGVNTWYSDVDGDGYGSATATTTGCALPVGSVANSDDCDDGKAEVHPGALEADCTDPIDYNCDGSAGLVDADKDGHPACEECDDSDDAVNPEAVETPYNGTDDDCEVATRDDDVDGDGALLADDCDDTDIFIGPDAPEIAYDGIDNDCDALTPDDDLDGDGVTKGADCDDDEATINPTGTEIAHDGIDQDCDGKDDRDGDNDGADAAFAGGTDCDDTKATVSPTATEVAYDNIDNDCNPATRDNDIDGDGFVKAADCNDNDATVSPAAKDVAHDGIDNDCDGADNVDGDGDGYDAQADGGTDCDDNNKLVNPNMIDKAHDGIDNDCDGSDNVDGDNDGFDASADGGTDCDDTKLAVNPDAFEIVYDGVDNDCDPATLDDDYDADGTGKSSGDCDDKNPAIGPTAKDTPYDGIDSDCSGGSDYDADKDGKPSSDFGKGPDCDDANPLITNCDGKTTASAAPSCLVAHEADPSGASGKYFINPVGNTKGVTSMWCDMKTDGGGYTYLKVDNTTAIGAAQMEINCGKYGMQLFVPRTYGHLDSAYKVAMDSTFGPSAAEEYLYVLGVYPNTTGQTCASTPMTSSNPNCRWRASDGGPWFVHWSRAFGEPNGDNYITGSQYYDWTTNAAGNVRIASHNDALAPIGYTHRYYTCDVGDKWGPPVSTAPRSCLAILQANPAAADGVYTINPDPAQTGAFQTYCDMSGGGWTLIGKGREGWTWDQYGQGSLSGLSNLSSNAVVTLPAWTVQALAGRDINTLGDGLRIEREESGQYGSTWRFQNMYQGMWWWDFTANWSVIYEMPGVGVVVGGTQDIQISGNDHTRIFTWAWSGHNNVMGWSHGCCGTQDTDGDGRTDITDGWQFATETHALPFTTLWIRR